MLRLIKTATPVLALIGVVVSIIYMGKYGEAWSLVFNIFCLVLLFWWYLANIVFRPMSKKDRRNLAFRKVVRK